MTISYAVLQIEPHDCIAELFAPLMRFNTILVDFDRCGASTGAR